MNYIVFKNGDSGVGVIIPVSITQTIEEIATKDVPAGAPYKIVSENNLPDRYFRSAWKFNSEKGIEVDIAAAKEIQRDHWRAARKEKLEELDVQFMRALESGDAALVKSIGEKKQALRDVTKSRLYNSLDSIKKSWPAVLKE